jgi:phytoene dehydrogenase-like protein
VKPDAVIIGAGPNGLVAANMLAERNWRVLVLEATDTPGGAVRSAELTEPDFTTDLFSAFYPLAAASPWIRSLELERWGLRWMRTPAVVSHQHVDGRSAALWSRPEDTRLSLDRLSPGDGVCWRNLYADWQRVEDPMVDALFTPFPPVLPAVRLAGSVGRDLLRFMRAGVMPVRRFAEERFHGEGGGWLLAGNALHADLTPDMAGSALFGMVLTGLGQSVGFPFPRGGAGSFSDALVRRLEALGGRIRTNSPVVEVVLERGRATGVCLADGSEIPAVKSVLADVAAPSLYGGLLPPEAVPDDMVTDLENFQIDNATFKVNWALDGPVPWVSEESRQAGTVHVAGGIEELSQTTSELINNQVPANPFLIFGQYSMTDSSRAPAGCESAWAYTHVPQTVSGDAGGTLAGTWDGQDAEAFAGRIEDRVEAVAPGFRNLIRARKIQTPRDLERANPNLIGGALNAGTAQLHQQLMFRPTPGSAGPRTPVRDLYLASASAHPGGGVHGGPGANAARAALLAERRRKTIRAGAGAVAGITAAGLLARRS